MLEKVGNDYLKMSHQTFSFGTTDLTDLVTDSHLFFLVAVHQPLEGRRVYHQEECSFDFLILRHLLAPFSRFRYRRQKLQD